MHLEMQRGGKNDYWIDYLGCTCGAGRTCWGEPSEEVILKRVGEIHGFLPHHPRRFIMSENNCAVYAHVNLINGKKYFGITTNELERRWKNGHGYYNNAHFKNAILKYGWDNFGHFVLYENIPIKIAKNIEEMLIREHMSYDPRFGYNKTMGGELEIPTEEARKKISESMNGHEVLEETRRKISESLSERLKNNPELNPNPPKPVEAIDPKTWLRVYYFKSVRDAGRAGFNHGHISACCLGKRKTHAGLIWRYVEGGNDDDGDN